jgi:hypothetical protein
VSESRQPLTLGAARRVAEQIIESIGDTAERVEIAGSIRRECDVVNDIEILAAPRYAQRQVDLFGQEFEAVDLVDQWARRLLDEGRVEHRLSKTGGASFGPRYKRLWWVLTADLRVALDLFSPIPHAWGPIMAIRTGPAALANQFVTTLGQTTHLGLPGLMPNWLRMREGQLTERITGNVVECKDERDFLVERLGLPWIDPTERVPIPVWPPVGCYRFEHNGQTAVMCYQRDRSR